MVEFLAEAPQKEERARRWCTLDEALERLTFEDTRRLLAKRAWPVALERFR